VRLEPSSVSGKMIFQLCIALSDGAVVHVVVQIWDDPANGEQLSEIVWKTRKVFFDNLAFKKGFPRIMLPGCQRSARTLHVSGEC
jgi:hypothetical protein